MSRGRWQVEMRPLGRCRGRKQAECRCLMIGVICCWVLCRSVPCLVVGLYTSFVGPYMMSLAWIHCRWVGYDVVGLDVVKHIVIWPSVLFPVSIVPFQLRLRRLWLFGK